MTAPPKRNKTRLLLGRSRSPSGALGTEKDDEATKGLCQKIANCLVDAKAISSAWKRFPIYIINDSELEDCDGMTHYDASGAAVRIGIRSRCPSTGRPYKRGAVAGTLLHEMAHALDGYRKNGKKAHSRSFYGHYARLVSAATRAGVFRMPAGMAALTPQTLCSFDSLDPFSDALDACVPEDQILQSTDQTPPNQDTSDRAAAVRVTLRHQKCGAIEKVAVIDTGSLESLHKAFRQKFPKKVKARMEYQIKATQDDREDFVVDEESLRNVRQGDTILASIKR